MFLKNSVINEAENKSYIDNNIIALVGGVGAGSKYFQSLLDLHPELYMIPGYSLLYFYPHYKEILKIKQSRESFVSIMLDRLLCTIVLLCTEANVSID